MSTRDQVRARRKIRRIRKKKAGRLRTLAVKVGKGVLSLAMLASLTFLGFTIYQYSQRFASLNIGEIKIMGCLNATETELLNLAKVDFKDSLVNLDLREVSNRLAQHPWVEKAKVKRDWSRKALIIEVRERIPQALILTDDLYLVDRNGEIFKKVKPGDRVNFPVLTGLKHREVVERNQQAVGLILQALELLDLLGKYRTLTPQDVSEVALSKKRGLTLFTLKGGIPIRLGSGGFQEKLDRLEKVLPDLRQKAGEVEYMDLNYPRKVVVKMKETGTEKNRKS